MYSWYKVFHGMPRDEKFKLIAYKTKTSELAVLGLWNWLLDYASQQEIRGSIENFDPEAFDVHYNLEDGTAQKILNEMERRKMIDEGYIQNWERFQVTDKEKARLRQQKCRARKREKLVQECHEKRDTLAENEEKPVRRHHKNCDVSRDSDVTCHEKRDTCHKNCDVSRDSDVTCHTDKIRLDKTRDNNINNIYPTATTERGVGETKPPSQSSDCSPSDDGTAEVAAETPVSVPECNSVSLQGEDLPETSANDCEDEFDLKPQGNENKKSRGGVYTCAEAVRWWNKHMVAAGFTPVSAVTETRKRKFRLRQKFFKDAGAYGRAFWEEVVFPRLRRSKFIREKPNLNTLDWLLKGDEHIVRLNEGLYDDREEEAWN